MSSIVLIIILYNINYNMYWLIIYDFQQHLPLSPPHAYGIIY